VITISSPSLRIVSLTRLSPTSFHFFWALRIAKTLPPLVDIPPPSIFGSLSCTVPSPAIFLPVLNAFFPLKLPPPDCAQRPTSARLLPHVSLVSPKALSYKPYSFSGRIQVSPPYCRFYLLPPSKLKRFHPKFYAPFDFFPPESCLQLECVSRVSFPPSLQLIPPVSQRIFLFAIWYFS